MTTSTTGGVAGVGAVPGEDLLDQPFYREYVERAPPAFVMTSSSPPELMAEEVNAVIHAQAPLRYVTPALFGNNAAVWNGDALLSETMLEHLSSVNLKLLRFPGGSTSDQYHFDGAYPAYAVAQGWDMMSEDWAVSTAEFMRVVLNLGAQPVITVNHGYASYASTDSDGSVDNAVRLAADWVEYCNAKNDGSNPNGGEDWAARRAADGFDAPFGVYYWEVGNEAYGSWEVGYDPDGWRYGEHFMQIARAMKAVDPNIAIGMVAPADSDYMDWTYQALTHPGAVDLADFLVVHNYFGWISDESQLEPESMLARTAQVAEYKARLEQLLTDIGLSAQALPFYFGEYNLPLPTHRYQIAHISGVFIAEVLGQLLSSGWAGASLWDVQNDYDPGAGLGAGDHGFLTRNHPGVPDLTPRPSYFPFFFFTRNFGNVMLYLDRSDTDISVYASSWQNEVFGVVAVNKSATPRTLTLEFTGAPELSHANLWLLHSDQVDSETTLLNGQDNGLSAGGPDPDEVTPYTLLFAAAPRISLPAYSVASLVLYQ